MIRAKKSVKKIVVKEEIIVKRKCTKTLRNIQ